MQACVYERKEEADLSGGWLERKRESRYQCWMVRDRADLWFCASW